MCIQNGINLDKYEDEINEILDFLDNTDCPVVFWYVLNLHFPHINYHTQNWLHPELTTPRIDQTLTTLPTFNIQF